MNVKLGTGFAWFTNPYDKIDNTENKLVGSHITNATELSLAVWFAFLPEWRIEAGTSFLHFSNGHTSIPNLGLNDVTAKVGIMYTPGTLEGIGTRKKYLPQQETTWKQSK